VGRSVAGAEVGFEAEAEGFASAVDERFGGGERATQDIGDLFVGEVLLAAEQDGETLVLGEAGEGEFDLLFEFGMEVGIRGAGGGGVVELVVERGVLAGIRGSIDGSGGVTAAPAQFVEAEVAGDGVEPGGEPGGDAVAVGRFVELDKDVLSEVFGFLEVAEHAIDQVHDGLFILVQQSFEGMGIAVLNTQHQLGVWVLLGSHGEAG
jgi:hypothetical protein